MNLDDDNLKSALRALADDSDSSAAIAATVRSRLRRRDRIRRTVAVGSLVAAVAATVTTASFLMTPAPAQIPAAGTPAATTSASETDASTQDTPPPPSGEITLDPGQSDQGGGANVVSVRCYANADVSNPDLRNYLSVTQVGGSGTADQAVSSCTSMWSDGTLTTQDPYIVDQPTAPDQAIPELIACLLPVELSDQLADSTGPPSRTIAVLPGTSETCGRLGLGAVDK